MQLVVTDKQTFTCTKSSASPEDGSFVVKQTSANSGKTNHHNKIPPRENKIIGHLSRIWLSSLGPVDFLLLRTFESLGFLIF